VVVQQKLAIDFLFQKTKNALWVFCLGCRKFGSYPEVFEFSIKKTELIKTLTKIFHFLPISFPYSIPSTSQNFSIARYPISVVQLFACNRFLAVSPHFQTPKTSRLIVSTSFRIKKK
jgi:hypothetical protein